MDIRSSAADTEKTGKGKLPADRAILLSELQGNGKGKASQNCQCANLPQASDSS